MSAAAVAAGVGTAFSIYSGITGGSQAKRERQQAFEEWQNNQNIALQLKAQEAPAQAAIQKELGILQSSNLTPEAQMSQDRLNAEYGNIQRQISAQAPLTGEGVAGGRALTAKFAQAQGIAGINLEDEVNKRAQLAGWVDRAGQVPGWARVATGANADMAQQQNQWSNQDFAASGSAYGQAALGLRNLALLYQNRQQTPPPAVAATQGGPDLSLGPEAYLQS